MRVIIIPPPSVGVPYRSFSVSSTTGEANRDNTRVRYEVRQKSGYLKRVIKGAKVGYNLETLPSSVNSFHMNPIVRVCRVIGGLSIVIWLGFYKEINMP